MVSPLESGDTGPALGRGSSALKGFYLAAESTLADVAALAGVSVATVSRVLNNRGYLSQATKDRVASAIEQLNYRPNEVARALHGSRTRTVGLIVPTVANPFFGELAEGVERALAGPGYRLLLCNSLGAADAEHEYLRQLEGRRVDGIITSAHNELIPDYATSRLPIVAVDRPLPRGIPNVRADNYRGGELAAELLLDSGCQRPALFTSRLGEQNMRQQGYEDALARRGVEPLERAVVFGPLGPQRRDAIYAALDAWLPQADGVFATDDVTACIIADWIKAQGGQIPADYKLVGFDGTATVRTAAPWLATVRQPIAEIANTAVQLLVDLMEDGFTPPDAQAVGPVIQLPVELLPAASTS